MILLITVSCVAGAPASAALATSGPATSTPTASPSASATATPKPTIIKSKPVASPDPYPSNPANLKAGNLHAQSCILIDGNTGEILFDKKSDTRLMPASITKMMTCLLAIEKGNLDDIVTISSDANKVQATYLPVKAGEEIVLKDLLTGMMLKSGNDAAVAVACHIAGDEKAFVEMMNQRAQEIGCKDTVYMNSHGLTVAGHVTTAYDQALIAQECLKNPVFREIVSTLEITILKNDVYTEKDRVITNANKFLPGLGDDKFGYEYGIGVKTGFTDAAQSTYVGAAVKDGVYLISVVLGSTQDGKWLDTIALMDYGFTRYEEIDVKSLYELNPYQITIPNASDDDPSQGVLTLKMIVPPDVQNDIIRMTPQGLQGLTENFYDAVRIDEIENLRAPVVENQVLAHFTLTLPGGSVFRASLQAPAAVDAQVLSVDDSVPTPTSIAGEIMNQPAPSLMKRFWWVFILPAAALLLILVGCILEIRHRKKRRTRSSYSRYTGSSYSSSRRR